MADAPKTDAPAKDEKAEKFMALAMKRTDAALDKIALIGNLGNKNAYHYTDEQAAKIVAALRAEVDAVEGAFKGKSVSKGFTF